MAEVAAEMKTEQITETSEKVKTDEALEPATEVEFTECGFCLRKREDLEEPRVLPCTHVHCFVCLKDSYELNHVLRCAFPNCGRVHDVALASLPGSIHKTYGPLNCDVCSKKEQGEQPAVIYCKTCTKKYCVQHQQNHDDLLNEHTTVDIREYKTEAYKLEVQTCQIHPEEKYTLGCEVCRAVYCSACSGTIRLCTTDTQHTFLPAKELMSTLNKTMDKSKNALTVKEEDIEKYFKTISKASSEYDEQTDKMVEMLTQTKDQQLEAITQKYEQQKEEFLQKRRKTKTQMENFLESTVATKCNEFRNNRLRIFAKIGHGTEYDQLTRFDDIIAEIDKYMEAEIPSLKLNDVVKLSVTGERREAETEITAGPNMLFHPQGLSSGSAPAKSLSLVKSVGVFYGPISISANGDTAYVTFNPPMAVISINRFSRPEQFLTKTAMCCRFDESCIFTLLEAGSTVSVCNMDGAVVNEWENSYRPNSRTISQFAIVSGKVVIPAPGTQILSVYSAEGEHIKNTHLPEFEIVYPVAICGLTTGAVVLANVEKSEVVKVDINSGDVLWKCTEICEPQGMAYDGKKCVYVYSRVKRSIYTLHVDTGCMIGGQLDIKSGNLNVYDLHISGDQLIVPLFGARKLLYYKMRKF